MENEIKFKGIVQKSFGIVVNWVYKSADIIISNNSVILQCLFDCTHKPIWEKELIKLNEGDSILINGSLGMDREGDYIINVSDFKVKYHATIKKHIKPVYVNKKNHPSYADGLI